MSEISNYRENQDDFVCKLKNCVIEKVMYVEDLKPTFDKDSLPFKFRYCLSTMLVTDKGNFLLYTAMTSLGYETFWIDSIESLSEPTSERLIHSKVKSVDSKQTLNRLPHKLTIELENGSIIIYAAEIYDNDEKTYTININDEMILVFEEESEANKFEASTN